ncbi:hypothetical protein [Reyranella sp.]
MTDPVARAGRRPRRPGGRIAGFTHQADELIPKRIELMRASDQ